MKEKSVFKGKYFNGKFGDIRVILDKEKPEVLFCAKDVAKALGFANPSTSVRDICLNTRKEAHMTDGGLQVLNFIDWGDIYNLYKHSKCEDKKEYIDCLVFIETDLFDKHFVNYEDTHNPDYMDLINRIGARNEKADCAEMLSVIIGALDALVERVREEYDAEIKFGDISVDYKTVHHFVLHNMEEDVA